MEAFALDKKSYQIGGIFLLILGIIGMIIPELGTSLILYLIAALLILGGVAFFVAGFKGGWANIVAGIILLAVGILMFVYPSESLSVMTIILGIWFSLVGIVDILIAFMSKSNNVNWWAPLITGILSFILAILIFAGWPENSEWIIGLFVAIELFLEGIMLLVISAYGE